MASQGYAKSRIWQVKDMPSQGYAKARICQGEGWDEATRHLPIAPQKLSLFNVQLSTSSCKEADSNQSMPLAARRQCGQDTNMTGLTNYNESSMPIILGPT